MLKHVYDFRDKILGSNCAWSLEFGVSRVWNAPGTPGTLSTPGTPFSDKYKKLELRRIYIKLRISLKKN